MKLIPLSTLSILFLYATYKYGIKHLLPCHFCDVTTANGFNIVHEDNEFKVFLDRSPAAELHLLIVPVKHIGTVNELKREDLEMLKRMQIIATKLLHSKGFTPENSRTGFHVPPFNSINHLHLHVLGEPFYSHSWFARKGRIKYETGTWWYRSLEEVILTLQGQFAY